MSDYFEGYYYKHQKDNNTLCIIEGHAGTEKFIQVITNDSSFTAPYSEGNSFSPDGIDLNIDAEGLKLSGKIHYSGLTPVKYDIMGPFKFFPMECRHGIVSMSHSLYGRLNLNGAELDFTGGRGYIEKDSGSSFPKAYTWIQANDFKKPCSVMAAIADIPFLGRSFKGCIGAIVFEGKEYRLATYLGAKIECCSEDTIIIRQGRYCLKIKIDKADRYILNAPVRGRMSRRITEAAACRAEFGFYKNGKRLFRMESKNTSFEHEPDKLNQQK